MLETFPITCDKIKTQKLKKFTTIHQWATPSCSVDIHQLPNTCFVTRTMLLHYIVSITIPFHQPDIMLPDGIRSTCNRGWKIEATCHFSPQPAVGDHLIPTQRLHLLIQVVDIKLFPSEGWKTPQWTPEKNKTYKISRTVASYLRKLSPLKSDQIFISQLIFGVSL